MLRQLLAHLLRGNRVPATASGAAPSREAFERLLWDEDYEGALGMAERLHASDPGAFEGCLLLGRAYQKLHRPREALAWFGKAAATRPEDAELHDFLGALQQETGRLDLAMDAYTRALATRPDFTLAAFHLGMARLLAGDFARGWDGYDLRRTSAPPPRGTAGVPRWDGTDPAGRTIFVAREQGLGDEIMFASVLPELMAQGGRWIVECDPRLAPILRRSFPAAQVFGSLDGGGLPGDAPGFDAWIEAGSLPGLRRRDRASFPRHQGYLHADPDKVARWRERLAALGPGFKVGIAWSGGVRMTRSALRSIGLDEMRPILRVPGLRFVSLQYASTAEADIGRLRANGGAADCAIAHWPEAIGDYDETAALVSALDLVVSVCTAVVHLAGALGRPAWVLTPLGPEWRYGAYGEDMPWYPSVRLFRQREYAIWTHAVDEVAGALHRRVAGGGGHADPASMERRAAQLAHASRHAEASEVLRDARAASAPRADRENLAGVLYTAQRRFDDAVPCYDAALRLQPALPEAWLNAAWNHRLRGSEAANLHFRRWVELATSQLEAYPVAGPAGTLTLPDVALCCVDTAYHALAARALRASLAAASFGDAIFLSDRDCGVHGVRFASSGPIRSLQDYSNFMIHRLHEHVTLGHVLVVQYDGFPLHPRAWEPSFLDYDYIGPGVRLPDGSAGGIGGFSLRSRRLLEALRDDPGIRAYDATKSPYAEDVAICCAFRRVLERRHGIRFAPPEVADRFAVEAMAPTTQAFGFHGLMHLATLVQRRFVAAEARTADVDLVLRADTAQGLLEVRRQIELRARGDAWARFLPAA